VFTRNNDPSTITFLHRYSFTVTEEQRSFAPMDENKIWYALYTRPRWEKKVAALLTAEEMEHYCPLNKVKKQWSDRKKYVLEPLFKGYVFVRIDPKNKWLVKSIEGVLNFVHWNGEPAIIRDQEIDTIRKFLQEFEDVQVKQLNPQLNDKVKIKQGMLMDYKGILIEIKGNKARVKIDGMGLQLSAVFDLKNLENVE
jgi:transcription antitermination factor NusG